MYCIRIYRYATYREPPPGPLAAAAEAAPGGRGIPII